MPNDVKTIYRNNRAVGAEGGRAGERFDTDAEIADKKERDAFDAEMGWSGLGGASKKPKTPAEYERQRAAWRAKKEQPGLTAIKMK
jgi:hypothetical protein